MYRDVPLRGGLTSNVDDLNDWLCESASHQPTFPIETVKFPFANPWTYLGM